MEDKVVLEGFLNTPLSWKVKWFEGEYVHASSYEGSTGYFIQTFESYELCRKFVLRELKDKRDDLGREMHKWLSREQLKALEGKERGEIWC